MPSAVSAAAEVGRVGPGADVGGNDGTRKRDSIALMAGLTVAYILLRSPLYIGDAVRWLPSVVAAEFPNESGGARHYFFPPFAWLVYHAGAALGLASDTGPVLTGAIAVVQGMNAILAAGAVVVTYHFLRLSASRQAALIGASFVACSNAFVMHATNMTEPVPSLVPALLGLYLVARSPERRAARLLGGALQGFATTLYLIAAVLTVPAAWYAFTRGAGSGSVPLWKRFRAAAEHLVTSGACYAGLIFCTEALRHPEHGLKAAAHQPFFFGLYGIYGQFRLRSILGALFGFASSLYPFPYSEGMSRIFHLQPRAIVTILAICGLALSFLAALAFVVFSARRRFLADGRWVEVTAGLLGFAAVYAVALYFIPGYDKFWLFAGFPVALVVSVAVDDAWRRARAGEAWSFGRDVKAVWFVLPGLLLLFANVCFAAVPRRFTRNLDMEAAIAMSERVHPNDLVVCRGWDGPSGYMRYALRQPVESLSLVDETLELGRSSERFAESLERGIARARAEGGRVYFLAVLEVPRETWQLFFGADLKLPYELFEPYRRASVEIPDARLAAANVQLFEYPLSKNP